MQRLREVWRKDGWLLAVMGCAVALCLLLGLAESSPAASGEEARVSQVLSAMAGAGHVEVAIHYDPADPAVPCGAVVVADGADDVAVRLRLSRAVTTLLGIEPGRVEVFKREGGT